MHVNMVYVRSCLSINQFHDGVFRLGSPGADTSDTATVTKDTITLYCRN